MEAVIKERLGVKVRSVELNVCQRAAGHLLSARDVNESVMVGKKAVEAALAGKSGVMVTTKRNNGPMYGLTIGTTEIEKIANQEKVVPETFVNEDKNGASDAGLAYLLPLIQGEVAVPMENGLPKYASLSRWMQP